MEGAVDDRWRDDHHLSRQGPGPREDLFSGLLGVEPSVDARYYVQFDVAGQQIGLDPNGHTHGMTPYWTVDDINATLQQLVEAGAETVQAVRDVGGGKLIAAVQDPDGNVIGITQDPAR